LCSVCNAQPAEFNQIHITLRSSDGKKVRR